MPKPLFVTGTARSGSTLLALMLSAHPELMVAADPFLPLIRSFRNAVARRASQWLQVVHDPTLPLQDYYFTRHRLAILDAVQDADLNIPFESTERPALHEATMARAAMSSPDLLPFIRELDGSTYRDLFDRALRVIAQVRNAHGRVWVGIKEVWTVEFCAALCRSYEDARFIVILRDPRAVVSSMMRIARNDPSQRADVLSYARHWRKQIALFVKYRNDPLLRDRILWLRYEDLMMAPEAKAHEICRFLDVAYDSRMSDAGYYFDYSTGQTWLGNSSLRAPSVGLDHNLTDRWRDEIDGDVWRLVDLVCGPDMILAGYTPDFDRYDPEDDAAALRHLRTSAGTRVSWRSDIGDPLEDFGFELFRRVLLDGRSPASDEDVVRRCFLFRELYDRLVEVRSAIPSA